MKKQLHKLKKLFAVFVGMGLALSSYAVQLSGGYTINPAAPATATNFKDFKSAIFYLTSATARPDAGPSNAAPFGISGPVKFTVSAATYTGQVIVPAITGTSPTNTLTFEGVNAATCIVRDSIISQAVFIIDQAKYVYVRNLTVENNGLNSVTGIAIIGSSSSNTGTGCRITGCTVNVPNTNTSYTSYGILTTATALGAGTSSNNVDSVWIDSNTVNGGYYSIFFHGNTAASTANNRANKARYNTTNNSKYYGMYIYYHYNQFDLLYNTVNMEPTATTQYGISFYYCQNQTAIPSRVIGNRVFNAAYMGLYVANSNNASGPATQIYNNVVAGKMLYSTNYGLYAVTTHRVDVAHNSVDIGAASIGTTQYAFYYTGATTGSTFKNNIFSNSSTAGTTTYAAYFSTNPTGNVANYNLYYNAAGTSLVYRGAAFTTATYKTATAGGDTSYNQKAEFAGSLDLHLRSACHPRGFDLTASVPADFDGVPHSTTPMVGAYEGTSLANDLKIETYLYPLPIITTGLVDLGVIVKNTGSTTITDFNVSYKLNGGTAVTIPWTGSLAPCDTVRVVFTGGNQINLVNANNIKVYTDAPNGLLDANRANDTFSTNIYTPFNGTIMVGPTQTFKTLSEVANALTNGGIDGPVSIMVDPGTYNGQVLFNGPILGSSATNTITIEGANASTTIINANAQGEAAVVFNKLKYVTFRKFTVNNTSVTGSGIAIVGTNTSNEGTGFKVNNCIINLPNTSYTASNGTSGIFTTGTSMGAGYSNCRVDSVEIDSNVINGGYYGIYFYGNTAGSSAFNRGNKVRNNTINAYYMGLNMYYHYNQVDLLRNTITMFPTTSTQYGIYFYYCQNQTTVPSRLIGNRIYGASYMGIYVANSNNASSAATQIYNNTVSGIFRYSTNYGIYTVTTHRVDVEHNSVDIPVGSLGGTQYAFYYGGATTGTIVKNNVFTVTAKTGSTVYAAYMSTNPTGNVLNYNMYYNAASPALVYRGSAYTSANYKTATAGGDSSFNVKPVYTTTTDLTPCDACTPIGVDLTANVPADINGVPRTTLPKVGAIESNGFTNDLSIEALVSPSVPVTAGTQDLVVRVKNSGNTIVTNFNLSYKNNALATVSMPWSGALNPCDTVTLTFTGADQINIGAVNNLSVYVSSPNSGTDGFMSNDSLKVTLLSPLNGTYTIGTGGTYPSFAAATQTLSLAGVTGPVVFNVLPGTYNEQVTLTGPIIGASATNTITFDGINAATRIISDSSNKASFIVYQASYVTVKNLTVTNKFKGAASGIAMVGNVFNNAGVGFTAKNNVVNLPNVGTNTSFGIIVTGNMNGTGDANHYVDSVTIDSNVIYGGYYGIQVSTSGNGNVAYHRDYKVRGNKITNAYYYGIRAYYIYNPMIISGNTIVMDSANTYSYGIYFYYCQNANTTVSSYVTNNNVKAGYTALYDYYTSAAGAAPTIIANNMLYTNGICYSTLYCSHTAAATVKIYHNSVNARYSNTYSGLYFLTMTAAGTEVKNNIFSVVGGTAAYFSTNPAGTNNINYNNYYNQTSANLIYRGSNYTAATYKTPAAGGDSSYNMDPQFYAVYDLHSRNGCTKGVDLTASFPTDIDGNVRPITPAVGAHETIGLANDITVDKVYINAPVTSGLQDISVRVRNMTPNAASTFNISYKLNGGATVTMPWSGTLLGCGDTAYVTFTAAQQANILSGSNSLKVFVSDPNGVVDNNNTNDTTNMALSTITKVAGNMFVGNGTGGNGTGSSVRFDSKPSMIGASTTKFTAEAWVKVGVYADQKFVAKSTTTNGFAIGIDPTGRFDAEIWTVANGTGSVRITTQGTSYPTNIIPLNTWTHVAVTWESGVGVRAYINGSLVGFLNSATATTMTQSVTDLFVGSNSWDGGHPVNGSVDEVRLWNVALDSVAIRRHMYSALTGTEPGLTSYIQFNEPTSATTFSDPVSASTGYKGAATVIAASPIAFGSDSTLTQTGVTVGTFSSYDVNVNIYDAFDNNCDLTITEIPNAPNTLPAAAHTFNTKYWNIRAFGNPGSFLADVTFSNFPLGQLNTTDAALGLYRRDNNSDGVWTLAKLSGSISPFSVTFNGVDTFGQFTIASNGTSTLPVSLISFGAKAGDDVVNVNWATANEIGSSHFEVERAYVGSENFETIGTVKAAGKSGKTVNYGFVDKTADLGQTIYYRLKQVDIDGKYKYSPVAVVEAQAGNETLVVYPNPASNDGLNITFASTKPEVAVITITDVAGKTVVVETVQTVAGKNLVKVPTSSMNNGVYFVSVTVNGTTQNTKLIKN